MEPERENSENEEEVDTPSAPSQPPGGRYKRSIIPPHLQKKKAHFLRPTRAHPVSLDPPQRLTSCIFPRPVTLVTNHPGNEVRYGLQEAKLQKPQQLCASWRLQAVKHQGTKEDIYRLEFENTFKTITAESQDGAQGQAGGESTQPAPGPSPFWKEMLPEAARLLPPSPSQQVSATDIRRQAQRVRRARKRLVRALEADRLAREAERMRGQEERAGNPLEPGDGVARASQM